MWAHFGCGSVAQLLTESKWISQGGFSLHSRCIVPSHDGQLTSCSSTGFAKFILNRMWKYQRPEKLNKSSLSIPEWRPMPVKSFTDLTLSVYKLHQRPAWIVSWSLVTKIVVSKVKNPCNLANFSKIGSENSNCAINHRPTFSKYQAELTIYSSKPMVLGDGNGVSPTPPIKVIKPWASLCSLNLDCCLLLGPKLFASSPHPRRESPNTPCTSKVKTHSTY